MPADPAAEGSGTASTASPGGSVQVRPLGADDGAALAAFGTALPEDDWLYLDLDLRDRGTVDRLVTAHAATNWRQLVAVSTDGIVGYANVRLLPGWKSHVGDAHLVIDGARRGRGLGTLLAQSIVDTGRELGVQKIILEILEEQSSGRHIFERLGFRSEGLLEDQARDAQGRLHNLLVLGYRLPDQP